MSHAAFASQLQSRHFHTGWCHTWQIVLVGNRGTSIWTTCPVLLRDSWTAVHREFMSVTTTLPCHMWCILIFLCSDWLAWWRIVMTTMLVMIGSYRAWSAERDRADGVPGAGGKPQQYGRDAGAHNARDGYMVQPPPRQWDNRGQYRPFVPGGMGCVSRSYLYHSCPILVFCTCLPPLPFCQSCMWSSLDLPLSLAATVLIAIFQFLCFSTEHLDFLLICVIDILWTREELTRFLKVRVNVGVRVSPSAAHW